MQRIGRHLDYWNHSRGYYRLNGRGKFIRNLWTGPLAMGIVFLAFYFPCHHVGLSIGWPLATAGVLVLPWVRGLLQTGKMWRDEVAARDESNSPE